MKLFLLITFFFAAIEATRTKRKPNVYIEVDLDEGPGGPGDGSRVIMISERQIASLLRDFKNICVKISSLKSYQNSDQQGDTYARTKPYPPHPHYSGINLRNEELPVYQSDEDFPHESPSSAHKAYPNFQSQQQNDFPPTLIEKNADIVRGSNFLNAMRNGFMCTTCNRNAHNKNEMEDKKAEQTKLPRSLNESEVFDDEVHFNAAKAEPERFMFDLPAMPQRTLLKRESKDSFSKNLQRTIKLLEDYDPRIKEVSPTEESKVERPNSVEYPVVNEEHGKL